MLDFSLSEEQIELQKLAHDFALKEIRPKAKHHDETGEFPREILRKAWELGIMNLHIPAELGGPGMGCVDEVVVAEEIAWGCSGVATPMLVNNLACFPVLIGGNDEQKKKYLEPVTKDFLFCSYAVTEPGAGSDVAGIKTTAKKVGNDYVLNGSKQWITGAGVANWFFVLAVTDPDKAHKGLSGFILPANTPGLTVGKKEHNLGQRASDTRALTFQDVVIPKANLLGKEGDGFRIAMTAFDYSRPPVAAMAVGVARAAMEHAIEYARTRQAFGMPIWKHQGVGFMVADMARNVQAARWLTWHAAWSKDKGGRNTLFASMAKSFAADMAMQVALDAVQVHGGYGYSKEYPVEKLMRDAKVIQIYEGSSQIQKVIITKELFERSEK